MLRDQRRLRTFPDWLLPKHRKSVSFSEEMDGERRSIDKPNFGGCHYSGKPI